MARFGFTYSKIAAGDRRDRRLPKAGPRSSGGGFASTKLFLEATKSGHECGVEQAAARGYDEWEESADAG